jgi:PKD repeat protein
LDRPPKAVGTCFPIEVLTGEQVEFDGKASSDLEGNLTFIWDFGDGNGSVSELVHHVFRDPGMYRPLLRVIDQAMSEDLFELPIIHVVNSPPNAFFTVHGKLQVNSTLVFDGSLSRDREGALNYSWDFGDGAMGEGQIISHSYVGPGNYTVSLNITDLQGASDEVRTVVWVKDLPTNEEEPRDDDGDGKNDDDKSDLESLVLALSVLSMVLFISALVLLFILLRTRREGKVPAEDGME